MAMRQTAAGGTDLPAYLFHQGTNYRAYEFLGVHEEALPDGRRAYTFRTFAPRASAVDVTGDFNGWSGSYHMERETEAGLYVYRAVTDHSFEGMRYKYCVTGKNGVRLKADPYAVYSETRMATASIVHTGNYFTFDDGEWMAYRRTLRGDEKTGFYPHPLNIYEVHLGSWMTRDSRSTRDGDNYLNYREIADRLGPYCKEMGYTHVELLPVMEHPFDGSWGYQLTGYYAPSSRFGTPEDFKYLVDTLHRMGIGVILDWVPAHFPKDAHGLFEFDGTPLYEYQGEDRREHRGWGTCFFDVGRTEVQSFLISNALYWLREFHADGIRCDAVAAMLYLDFDRSPGEWNPNPDGSNRNLQAEAFFRKLNTVVGEEFPDALMIAEESSDYPGVTRPVSEGGLGFQFKWNMGFANDLYDYVSTDPYFRQYKHERLTFPLMYAFAEHYILPVSHDEVVHGKRALLDKMFGSYEQKFATMRAFLCYLMTQPGKKMLFMGCEYAPFREWDFENSLEWFMLDYEKHRCMRAFTAALNHFYLSHGALYERDFSWAGFRWLSADDAAHNIVVYERYGANGQSLTVALNFSADAAPAYRISAPGLRPVHAVFESENPAFGGSGQFVGTKPKFEAPKKDGEPTLTLALPGLSATIYEAEETAE